ncbi:hypothetical protein AFK24_17065 [Pseudomonas syringae]|uniref:Transmembrane protein n=1 Tax=Pseudomonas syringae TaxID=317 RepID=A0A1C7Z1X2_PSESX|nr:hypothetical protein [Pseudomonas syringae]OCR24034.1 hypothetical protein AFK24_17065 [Pseudomonas syringae]
MTTQTQTRRPITKIIVAIHGIGSQSRSNTIRTVAHRFGSLSEDPPPIMPLGFFQLGNNGEVHVSKLEVEEGHPMETVGFAEIYWADVPKRVVTQGDTLEESKAWGKTVVARAHALYQRRLREKNPCLDDKDFALAAGAVDEILEAVTVIENLSWVFKKSGVFEFQISSLLTDYIGDVQLVADFKSYRKQIIDNFHDAMTQIVDSFKTKQPETPRIYIVAHSEGTVISFLAMLEALSAPVNSSLQAESGRTATYQWIQHVSGFMTLGSPIDKHILLWPKLWPVDTIATENFTGALPLGPVTVITQSPENGITLPAPIKWRNYYDFGDPVGFQLDSARAYLQDQRCAAFEFNLEHDFGFARYWLPGKAHVDYWQDPDVFHHFIDDVVFADPSPKVADTSAAATDTPGTSGSRPAKSPPPKTRQVVSLVSVAIPYVLSFLLHVAAVYFMLKAVMTFLYLDSWTALQITTCVITLSILLASITVAGRLPRLVKRTQKRWWILAIGVYAVGAFAVIYILDDRTAAFLTFGIADATTIESFYGVSLEKAWLIGLGAFVAASCWLVPRNPRWGRRFMVGSGMLVVGIAIAVGYINAPTMFEPPTANGTAVKEVKRLLWPLVLAALAFIYLWWLAILTFDLAFIWHRYIRNSVAIDAVRCWQDEKDAKPRTFKGREPSLAVPHFSLVSQVTKNRLPR